ncbi:MAG: DUF697 domain-containing protein [Nitrospinae bacterium]|nr:DUF697 domain-containing protein [Nitrospinota bacterium]
MNETLENKPSAVSGNLEDDAMGIVRKHVYAAMGFGLLPIPGFDIVAMTGTQLNLVRMLSNLYGVGFKKEAVKGIIGSLVGGFTPVAFAAPVASLLKLIPVVGQTAGGLSLSLTGGASTYALGKVFIQHFASGGTMLTFDPAAMKNYYTEKYCEGIKVASEMKEAKAKGA